MKILVCHNYYQLWGGEDQCFEQDVTLLRENGHNVELYVRHNDDIKSMPRREVARKTIWNHDSYDQVTEIIRQQRPDVMHCNNTFPLISPSVYYAASREGVPVVQTLHNYRLICAAGTFMRDNQICLDCMHKPVAWPAIRHRCYRDSTAASTVVTAMLSYHRMRKTWQNKVDRYVALTEFSRDKFLEAGLPADKISLKSNYVAPDPGIGKGEGEYIAFAGRLSVEKGIDTLLEAWSKVSGPARLKVVGEGPMTPEVERAAAKDPRIEYLGWLPLDQVCQVVSDASALIMPSVWFETFGRTIAEAFSVGTPAVVSNLGAMSELVTDGKTGFLFNPGDAEELSRILQRVVDEPQLVQGMRTAARAEYEAKYAADANYEQLIDIYEQAVAAFSNRAAAN